MSRLIVGLCGYAGSGKSTAADYLVKKHGFVRVRFAQKIKDMAAAIGLDEHEIEGELKDKPCSKLGGRSPRYFMQRLGTEFGRQMIDDDLWCNLWAQSLPKTGKVVVDDVRFSNERAMVKYLKGKLYKVERQGVHYTDGSHISEAVELLVCDAVVLNNTTAADLGPRLAQVLNLE